MITLEKAISIARSNNKGLIIDTYMDSGNDYIFPVDTPNGMDGSTFYYKVDKSTGDHGIFSDYWFMLMTDPKFGEAVAKKNKIKEAS